MPSFTITIDDVKSRDVRTKDGRQSTIFQVFDEKGTRWETWKKQIANEAYRAIGETVRIRGRIEQNGEYENYYIDDLEIEGNGHSSSQRSELPERQQTRREITDGEPTQKTRDIHRQTATKVAAWLVGPGGNPPEFWDNVQTLIKFYEGGEIPSAFQGTPQREANQFVPDNFEDRDSQYKTDDDIPF